MLITFKTNKSVLTVTIFKTLHKQLENNNKSSSVKRANQEIDIVGVYKHVFQQ